MKVCADLRGQAFIPRGSPAHLCIVSHLSQCHSRHFLSTSKIPQFVSFNRAFMKGPWEWGLQEEGTWGVSRVTLP